MSSVMMSMTRREGSNAPGDRAGPGRGQVLDRDVPVVGLEVAEQVADVQAG
jgi:hypothetical protein